MKPSLALQQFVLGTLSFFEPMTLSQIILDFDKDLLDDFPDLDKEKLGEVLDYLEKEKSIKKVKIDKEMGWIRVYPKKGWWKRLISKL